MSQYPPPYPTQQHPSPYAMDYNTYAPAFDFLAPARRASIGMFVLGGLCLLCGTCFGVAAGIGPMGQIVQQVQQAGMQIPPPGVSVSAEQFIRTGLGLMGVGGAALGIALIVLGIFVRRGRKGATVASLIICVPVLLLLVLDLVRAVPAALAMPAAIPGIGMALVVLILLGMIVFWMFQALRVSPQLAAQQQQWAAQMWQYQQQQAAYGGYNPPQVTPAPPYSAPPSSNPTELGAPERPDAQSLMPPPNPPDASM